MARSQDRVWSDESCGRRSDSQAQPISPHHKTSASSVREQRLQRGCADTATHESTYQFTNPRPSVTSDSTLRRIMSDLVL